MTLKDEHDRHNLQKRQIKNAKLQAVYFQRPALMSLQITIMAHQQ